MSALTDTLKATNERKTEMNKVSSHLDTWNYCRYCDADTWHVTVSVLSYPQKEVLRYETECEDCMLSDI